MAAPLPFSQLVTIAQRAIQSQDGHTLALLLGSPLSAVTENQAQVPLSILGALSNSTDRFLNPLAARLPEPFREVLVGHVQVLVLIQQAAFPGSTSGANDSWIAAYKVQHAIVSAFLTKHLQSSTSWSLPALYVLLRTLRHLATKSDAGEILEGRQKGWARSEECARTGMKAFTVCATDRTNSGPQARQLGIYHLASLLIKSYFTLSRPSLSTNLIRALDNATNRQPLSSYPKAEQVTWRFLMGTLALLDGKWAKARDELDSAWSTCHWKAERNLRQILTLLIPIKLLLGLLPSDAVMRDHPLLARLYGPFVEAVRKSDLHGYDKALEGAMEWAVDKKVWAALERGREVVVRGALRKTWLALGKPARVKVSEFQAGLLISSRPPSSDPPPSAEGEDSVITDESGMESIEEVECLLAGMIYKGYMKGYISHSHQLVVLSKVGAFPALSTRVAAGPE